MDAEVARQLFRELDIDKDGTVSWQEFMVGLQSHGVPVTDELDVLKGLLHSSTLIDMIALHLMDILHQRLEAGEKMSTDAVRWLVCGKDITTVLQGELGRNIEKRFGEQLQI